MRRRGSVIYVPAGVPASLETLHYFNITTSTRLVYRCSRRPLERKAEFTKPSLLAPGLLRSGVQYAFRLLVSDGSTGYAANASQLVVVLEPPVISSVGGAPLSGVAWRTTFVLNAFGERHPAHRVRLWVHQRRNRARHRQPWFVSIYAHGDALEPQQPRCGDARWDGVPLGLLGIGPAAHIALAGAHKIVVTARDSMGSAASRLSNETYVAVGRSITYPPGLSRLLRCVRRLRAPLDVVPDNATGATPTPSRDMCFRANQLLQFIENGEADRVMRIIEEAGTAPGHHI